MEFQNPRIAQVQKKLEEAAAERQREEHLQKQKEKLSEFDQRIADLAAMIEKNQELAEDEFNINVILIQFLEVMLNMKKVMDMCQSIEQVLSCVADATKFIDDSMNFSDEIFAQMNTEKYGFFARIKQRIAIRKTIQNHIGRMEALVDRVNGMVTVGEVMSVEFGKLSKRMGKAKKKKKSSASAGSEFPLASQYLSKRKTTESGAGSTPATPATSAPASSSSAPSDDLGGIL